MPPEIYHSARIFDGHSWHENAALIVEAGRVIAITPQAQVTRAVTDSHSLIVPGLIDLQVNGGGGVQFNNEPERLTDICTAHAQFGTTAIMATLITDQPQVSARALNAAQQAKLPNLLGLHFEGPHLALSRKGTHDGQLIRPMQDADLELYRQAARELDYIICTIAPESVTPAQVQALTQAGVIVSLGHSDCDYETACAYHAAGARMVTHLFNAMSQLGHRAPGLVGAALGCNDLWAGLIADGHHVAPAALRLTLRAKANLFLVSDAMCTIGSDLSGFRLNNRDIIRSNGRLTLAKDGTLAGADIALIDAVRYLHQTLNVALDRALQLASLAPAQAIGAKDRGHLKPGARADFISLTPDLQVNQTWIDGHPIITTAENA